MSNRIFRKDQDVIAALIALGFVSNADFKNPLDIRVYDYSSLNALQKTTVTDLLLGDNYTFLQDE